MRDVNKALSDILEIRSRIAAGTAFRGYGPLAIAITGLIGFSLPSCRAFICPIPRFRPPPSSGVGWPRRFFPPSWSARRCRAARAVFTPTWLTL